MTTYSKTIIVTGCAGLIGSHVTKKLLTKGYEVIGIDNLVGGYEENLCHHKNFTFLKLDIQNPTIIKQHLLGKTIDTVIHCAALAHEGLSVFSPSLITGNIYFGTISMASVAISLGAKLFINTSSMARYGNIQTPFKEHDAPNPVDPYGMAKLQAEQQLNLLSDIHGIKVVHMVPHNVCGLGQCYSDPFRNVMSIFINRMLQSKPIYIYGNGEQKRSFSYVGDCISAYINVLENDQIANKEVFNIGPTYGTEITINDLATHIADVLGITPDIRYLPARPREVTHAWVDTNKAKNVLNYKDTLEVRAIIADTSEWIRNNGVKDFNYHLPLEIVNDTTPKTWVERLY